MQDLYALEARKRVIERGVLTPGEVEWIKVWNGTRPSLLLRTCKLIVVVAAVEADAIHSVPIENTAADDHEGECTVKKEDESVLVTRDEGGADGEEDDVVVVEETEADEKDYVTVEKLQRRR